MELHRMPHRPNYAFKPVAGDVCGSTQPQWPAVAYRGARPSAKIMSLSLFVAVLMVTGCARHQASNHQLLAFLPQDAFAPGWEEAAFQADDSIPERYWQEKILVLKPIRAYRDRANIAVVTAETADTETGVYFYVTESSYLPIKEPGRIFHWNASRQTLDYVWCKSETTYEPVPEWLGSTPRLDKIHTPFCLGKPP
jgi:hypothetical protein